MNKFLVTGATGFLGYHVAKRLNEVGVRPRVLDWPGRPVGVLDNLDVERCDGDLTDDSAMAAACSGMDFVLHTALIANAGSNEELVAEMQQANIEGTRRLVKVAADNRVRRVVVTSTALAVGVNRRAVPLDESADWAEHGVSLPYAVTCREAELAAFAAGTPHFGVLTVCPAFTFGPEDPTSTLPTRLLRALVNRKLWCSFPVGLACLDVRDYAYGVVLAAKCGRSGQRYLLSGENVMARQLLHHAAAIAGVRAPRVQAPTTLLGTVVGAHKAVSTLRRKHPRFTFQMMQLVDRYAWYHSVKARADFGWRPRPLQRTLEDTIRWINDPAQRASKRNDDQADRLGEQPAIVP